MGLYNEIYDTHSNNNDNLKNNAIAYGNGSYILINKDNEAYVDKYYINGYTIYGEKHIQYTIYADGYKNEISMYKYANTYNLSYVPRMISYNDTKVMITMEYLKNYITIRKYFELRKKLSETINELNNNDNFFKALVTFLNTMEKDNFVHNNLTLDNIMINPENMDFKVVNLKNSYIFNRKFHGHLNKNNAIFEFAKNDLLFTIYKVIYPKEKNVFMNYFKYRNPYYYRDNSNTKIGDFYRIGILQLFNEQLDNTILIEDQEIQTFVKNISFFTLYIKHISQ